MKFSFTGEKDILRGHDDSGSGAFGASRGDRIHQGVDIVAQTNQDIKVQKTDKVSHQQRIKVSIVKRTKVSHPERVKVSH